MRPDRQTSKSAITTSQTSYKLVIITVNLTIRAFSVTHTPHPPPHKAAAPMPTTEDSSLTLCQNHLKFQVGPTTTCDRVCNGGGGKPDQRDCAVRSHCPLHPRPLQERKKKLLPHCHVSILTPIPHSVTIRASFFGAPPSLSYMYIFFTFFLNLVCQ